MKYASEQSPSLPVDATGSNRQEGIMKTDRIAVVHTGYGYVTGMFSSCKLENVTFDSVAFSFVAADEHPAHQETGRATARRNQEAYGAGRPATRQPKKLSKS